MNKKKVPKKSNTKFASAIQGKESLQNEDEISNLNKVETKTKIGKYNSCEAETNLSSSKDSIKVKKTSKKKNKIPKSVDITIPVKRTKSNCDSTQTSFIDESTKISIYKNECQENSEQEKVMENYTCEKNKLKYLNAEESQIKEEDIDQYCEDLDDESNSKYEEWIKLVDAKLHSGKSK